MLLSEFDPEFLSRLLESMNYSSLHSPGVVPLLYQSVTYFGLEIHHNELLLPCFYSPPKSFDCKPAYSTPQPSLITILPAIVFDALGHPSSHYSLRSKRSIIPPTSKVLPLAPNMVSLDPHSPLWSPTLHLWVTSHLSSKTCNFVDRITNHSSAKGSREIRYDAYWTSLHHSPSFCLPSLLPPSIWGVWLEFSFQSRFPNSLAFLMSCPPQAILSDPQSYYSGVAGGPPILFAALYPQERTKRTDRFKSLTRLLLEG